MKINKTKRIGLNIDSWIEALLDENSLEKVFFSNEISVFSGLGTIHDRPVAFYGHNPKIDQGFVSSIGAQKIVQIMDLAFERKIPLISFVCSPGVSVSEGLASGHEYTQVIVRNIKYSGIIPQISIVLGTTMGATAYSATLSDFVLFNKSRSTLMVTGPSVIEKVIGEKVSIKELGGSEVHAQTTGIADFVDKDIASQISRARALVSFLPANALDRPPARTAVHPIDNMPSVPVNSKESFEMKEFALSLCDAGEFMEHRAEYGKSMLCLFAYIGGQPFGIMANQSKFNAGVIDCDTSIKSSRFLRLCDAYNLPIINLIDVPGFMPGKTQEHLGLLRHGASLCQAMQTTTLRYSVVVRKCYGAAAFIMMQTRAQGGQYVWALDNSKIAVMGHDGAASMLEAQMSPEQYYDDYEDPEISKKLGIVDEIISSTQLRDAIIERFRQDSMVNPNDLDNKKMINITP
ncbi:acyl-CoA carboxylase subunit beta [Bacteriovorax sp. Seq25_V]|uniref:acyl-CoA carboxylase subunit beta n=1 Tax=Bacteriovorax sp. Seq25_V TaxID=1201288 RepID=UPI000389F83B|nr:carboxyl transferase domain-containing protein [Bacteriovorax sp. Seq25_V]EQC47698.1 carboxyl transferase domain protein [Bacteriovorax sp. Seq25_V]